MSLPSVDEALAAMLARVTPLSVEAVPLNEAAGRILAEDLRAQRDQPPFDASSMDGWAVRREDVDAGAATLAIVGESAAGRPWAGRLERGQTVRISTGAALPLGADMVVIQEEAERKGEELHVPRLADRPAYVRPQGCDFSEGAVLLNSGVRLHPWPLSLAAASGAASVATVRRPRVAILTTGDELAVAGSAALPHQIFDAAGPAVAAACLDWDAEVSDFLAAHDSLEDIQRQVAAAEFDLLVTIGGASVGDHDLVKPALRTRGLQLDVEGVAVRPGKPTWFGRLGDGALVLGLPGNPASALVCAELFLRPVLTALQGQPSACRIVPAHAGEDVPENGPREHYMRGRAVHAPDGRLVVSVADDQDSSLVTVLARSNALVRRVPRAAAAKAGDLVDTLLLSLPGRA